MATDSGERGCEKKHYEITPKDLPLCCPLPEMRVWDSHPRVYLELNSNGEARCPYCSAEYKLIEK